MITATRPRLSGFCNPTLPRTDKYDPHQKCHGCDCRAPGCPCNPDPPQEDPVTALDPGDFAYADEQAHAAGAHDDAEDASEPGTPEDAVAWARSAADALNTALKGYSPEDWTDAARLLYALRKVTGTLHALDAGLVQWLYLHGEHGIHLRVDGIPGDLSITRGRAKERWEGEAAVRDYVGARIRALGGEVPDPEQVIEWVLEVVPAAKCRVTPLRTVGLDVEDYRTSEPGNLQVGLPKDQP